MTENKNLYETINERKAGLRNFNPEIFEIPKYITDNLKHNFFQWQTEALENLLYYENPRETLKEYPTHLMFNMATGAGKTLLMAAAILYYYQRGYRHVLFFVNRNNIVDKTENNFIDTTHAKYLFTEKIVIDDKTINIKNVDTFSDTPPGIEIKFTSIQKLYNDIHLQRENRTTLEELHNKNIVMLADEAHHLNADTKKSPAELDLPKEITGRTGKGEVEKRGWEHTVIELILKKNGQQRDNKNVLLEFTATIPDKQNVQEKYADKIVYKFELKEFLQAGYTKEINLISSTLVKKERVLQALLFQWYRHRIALKYGIANFKPVILFRSKTIAKSKEDYEEFLNWVHSIAGSDFNFLNAIFDKISQNESINEQGKSRTEQVLRFVKSKNISYVEIAQWVKDNFSERNIIITNSETNDTKTEKTDASTEKLLNSLEDKDNHIRAIFTVERLTEGWDVLNLFDIVRLYEGRDERKGKGDGKRKTGSATIAEKQLIGRGVRYFPFAYDDKIKNKRKFDEDLTHELRVLEELYFYSTSEYRYIDELKRALKESGYIRDDRVMKTFAVKKDILQSDFFKNTKIWYNEQIDNPHRRRKNLDDIQEEFAMQYKITALELHEEEIALANQEDIQRLNLQETRETFFINIADDIEKHIFLKAINIKAKQEGSLLQFEKLKEELEIDSIEELQTNIFANFSVEVVASNDTRRKGIQNSDKLELVIRFLDKILAELKGNITPKIGGEFTDEHLKKFFSEPKTKSINVDNEYPEIAQDNQWYLLDSFVGTDVEKEFIEFIKNKMGNLEKEYKEIHLLRNEEVYKIYDFKTGRGFQPDFILFLKTRNKQAVNDGSATELYYQVFVEAKGDIFLDGYESFKDSKEAWKEKFLAEITTRYGCKKVLRFENQRYRLIGLPFFHTTHNREKFDEALGWIVK